MTNYQHLLQPRQLFSTLGALASQHHIKAYVIGGFVRDALRKKIGKDIDIVCLGGGMTLAKALASQIPGAHVTLFKTFGTAMVKWEDFQVEFVNARKESYAPNSRKPQVTAGTLEDDILRRDFTINTIAISLNKASWGELIDLCGGKEDLENKRIRTPLVPGRTFSDDPLRMLRGIRFAVQLGGKIDRNTFTAMRAQAHRLSIVSKERIIVALNKILVSTNPARGLRLLDRTGLLRLLLPEMEALKGVESINGLSHKDNFIHTLKVVDNLANLLKNKAHPKRLWLIWAAILHDIAKPMTKRFDRKTGFSFHGHETLGAKMVPRIFKRLGLPLRQDMRYVQKLVLLHLRHIPLVEHEVTDAAVRRFLVDVGDELDDLMLLCRADITSGNPIKVATYLANFDKIAHKIKQVEAKDHIRNFKPVITGDIIMKTFDLKPSRKVGSIKDAVKEAILEGKIPNQYPPAYQYMIDYAKTLKLVPIQPS